MIRIRMDAMNTIKGNGSSDEAHCALRNSLVPFVHTSVLRTRDFPPLSSLLHFADWAARGEEEAWSASRPVSAFSRMFGYSPVQSL